MGQCVSCVCGLNDTVLGLRKTISECHLFLRTCGGPTRAVSQRQVRGWGYGSDGRDAAGVGGQFWQEVSRAPCGVGWTLLDAGHKFGVMKLWTP